jgi:predicted enzyme related to lactoylglutathione lyase
MNLKLNWLGIHVADFAAALRFYTEVLGLNATDVKPDWAYFATTGMTFELFGGGRPPVSGSKWGQGQAVRPGIQVADLRAMIAELRARGIQFTGEIEQTDFGEWIEFSGPENMRWTLVQAPAYSYSSNLRQARLGWLELKVEHLIEQRNFYKGVLGLQPENNGAGCLVLRQGPGEPLLFLESGGQQAAPYQISQGMFQPLLSHLMSFETDNIEAAAAWLKARQVPILIDITQKNWGGIDLYIADLDGNPIQVVQYVQK